MKGERNRAIEHRAIRVSFGVDQPYEEFRERYEQAVPPLDTGRINALVERKASWEEVVADAQISAPFGFFIFWRLDTAPLMALAGHSEKCTEYLMGNHTIAEQMFRFDPSVMLYAPLRTLIHTDREERTRFVIDLPSTVFSSFENPEISKVGKELDAKLLRLLSSLEVDVAGIDGEG
jgi:hypothetical protein